jgi:hypothetical protein
MTSIEAAGLWAGFNALLLIYLSARVGLNRTRLKINLGDGANPDMSRAIRAQANYTEYAPAALLGLVLLALLGAPGWVIHALGSVFLFARIAHFLGLGLGAWPIGRMVGTLFTMLTLLATGLGLIWLAAF